MAQEIIDIGAVPNDPTADTARDGFGKVNDNFTELYAVAPSTGQKTALAGTSGTPGAGNEYVTDDDPRNTDTRTPASHAASHKGGGSDVIDDATTALAGLMSSVDKTKLDAILAFLLSGARAWINEDFIGNDQAFTTVVAANERWTSAVSGAGSTLLIGPSEAGHPGIVRLTGGAATGRYATFYHQTDMHILGEGAQAYECILKSGTLATVTNDYAIRVGYGDNPTAAAQVDGVFFEYNRSATGDFWVCKTVSNSTTTSTTVSAIAANTWYKLRVEINAAGSSVAFYINGALVATHATNIPTGIARVTGLIHHIIMSATTAARFFDIDKITWQSELTVPR